MIKPSGYAVEVEIKIMIQDLKSEEKKKHNHYDKRIREFYFALPNYLIEAATSLIPKHAGIISCERNKTSGIVVSHIIRNAEINKNSRKLTDAEKFKVARLGTMRIFPLKKKIIKHLHEKIK